MFHHLVLKVTAAQILAPVLVLAASLAAPAQAADFPALLKNVPNDANALLLIDAESLKRTTLAEKQGWFDARPASHDRPWYLPPEAERIVVAASLDTSSRLTPRWEAALISLGAPFDLPAVARSEGGYVDDLGGHKAVWAPTGVYLIPFEGNVLGELAPPNRQAAARWAATRGSDSQTLSPYLTTAAGVVSERAPIVMAFDLAGAIPPHAVYDAIRTTTELQANATRRDEIARVLASLQGVTAIVAVGDDAAATLRFDFAEDVGPLVGSEAKLFAALVDRLGASVRATEDWNVKASGKAVRANGRLGVTGLRRLLSLIELPTTKFSSLGQDAAVASSTDKVLAASKDYYGSVAALIDDLRETLDDHRDNHATYCERYARKVDRLPILNVDDELLTWGATVAETLRDVGLAQRTAGLRAGVRKAGAYGSYQYSYGNNGYYSGQSTQSAQAQVTTQEQAAAKSARFGSWKEIEDSSAAIRAAMTKKYGVEF